MTERMKTLAEIDKIIFEVCGRCEIKLQKKSLHDRDKFCLDKCSYGKEIAQLGKVLSQEKDDKRKAILEKGKDMTLNEIRYLRLEKVPRRTIADAIGMHTKDTKKFFDQIEAVGE